MIGLLLSFFLWTHAAGEARSVQVTPEDLDAVMKEAGDFDTFRNGTGRDGEKYTDKYRRLCIQFYGPDRYTAAQHDGVFGVVFAAVDSGRFPNLKKRLFEEFPGQPFSVTTIKKSSGMELRSVEWQKYVETKKKEWRRDAEPWIHLGPKPLADYLKSKTAEVRKLEESLKQSEEFRPYYELWRQGLAEKKKIDPAIEALSVKRQAMFHKLYKGFKEDPKLQSAAAYLAFTEFDKRPTSGVDADEVLDLLERIRTEPADFFGVPEGDESQVAGILSRLFPHPRSLGDYFTTEKRPSRDGKTEVPVGKTGYVTYDVVPVPRVIHTVVKDIAHKFCIGGALDGKTGEVNPAQISPERILSAALSGTLATWLMRSPSNGPAAGKEPPSYVGIIELNPIVKSSGATYGNINMLVPDHLRRRIVYQPNPNIPETRTELLYHWWLREQGKRIPKDWKGLVIGRSSEIMNNMGNYDQMRRDPSYAVYGKQVGRGGFDLSKRRPLRFTHPDPLAQQVVDYSPRMPHPFHYYQGNMALDGTAPGAGPLVMLDTNYTDRLNRIDYVKSQWKKGGSARKRLLRAFVAYQPYDPAVSRFLSEKLDPDSSEVRKRKGEAELLFLNDRRPRLISDRTLFPVMKSTAAIVAGFGAYVAASTGLPVIGGLAVTASAAYSMVEGARAAWRVRSWLIGNHHEEEPNWKSHVEANRIRNSILLPVSVQPLANRLIDCEANLLALARKKLGGTVEPEAAAAQ